MHRNDMRACSTAQPGHLRNVVNYEEDLHLNQPAATGIKTPCMLNDVENYHVTANYAPDVMHDLLEGVCGLEVHLVLAVLIEQHCLTLTCLIAASQALIIHLQMPKTNHHLLQSRSCKIQMVHQGRQHHRCGALSVTCHS